MGSDSDAASESEDGREGAGYQEYDTFGEHQDITDYFLDEPEADNNDNELEDIDVGEDEEEEDDDDEEAALPLNQLAAAPTQSQEPQTAPKRRVLCHALPQRLFYTSRRSIACVGPPLFAHPN